MNRYSWRRVLLTFVIATLPAHDLADARPLRAHGRHPSWEADALAPSAWASRWEIATRWRASVDRLADQAAQIPVTTADWQAFDLSVQSLGNDRILTLTHRDDPSQAYRFSFVVDPALPQTILFNSVGHSRVPMDGGLQRRLMVFVVFPWMLQHGYTRALVDTTHTISRRTRAARIRSALNAPIHYQKSAKRPFNVFGFVEFGAANNRIAEGDLIPLMIDGVPAAAGSAISKDDIASILSRAAPLAPAPPSPLLRALDSATAFLSRLAHFFVPTTYEAGEWRFSEGWFLGRFLKPSFWRAFLQQELSLVTAFGVHDQRPYAPKPYDLQWKSAMIHAIVSGARSPFADGGIPLAVEANQPPRETDANPGDLNLSVRDLFALLPPLPRSTAIERLRIQSSKSSLRISVTYADARGFPENLMLISIELRPDLNAGVPHSAYLDGGRMNHVLIRMFEGMQTRPVPTSSAWIKDQVIPWLESAGIPTLLAQYQPGGNDRFLADLGFSWLWLDEEGREYVRDIAQRVLHPSPNPRPAMLPAQAA